MNPKNGLSIIEIMIVVAIISLLAAVGHPAYRKWRGRAIQAQAKQELASLYTSQRSFKEEFKTYHWHLPVTAFLPAWINRADGFPADNNGKRYYGITIPVEGSVPTVAALGLSSPGGFAYAASTGYRANLSICRPAGSALAAVEIAGFGSTVGDVSTTTFRAVALGCPMGNLPATDEAQLDRWSINQLQLIQHHNVQP